VVVLGLICAFVVLARLRKISAALCFAVRVSSALCVGGGGGGWVLGVITALRQRLLRHNGFGVSGSCS